jgi:hypothetical protein
MALLKFRAVDAQTTTQWRNNEIDDRNSQERRHDEPVSRRQSGHTRQEKGSH